MGPIALCQKNEIHLIFTLCFYIAFVRYKLVKLSANKTYKQLCLVIIFNSCLHDMTSIKHYISQSTISFIRDVDLHVMAPERLVQTMYESRLSKIGSSEEVVGESKYSSTS